MGNKPIPFYDHPLVDELAPMFVQPCLLATARRVGAWRWFCGVSGSIVADGDEKLLPLREIHRLQRTQNSFLEYDIECALHLFIVRPLSSSGICTRRRIR